MLLDQFFIPLITTVLGGLMVFFIQKYLIVGGKISFLGYPKISGLYKVFYENNLYPDGSNKDSTSDDIIYPEELNIHQIGSRITGTVYDPNTNNKFDFFGNVSRTRIITYQYRPKDPTIDSYGSAMYMLSKTGKTAVGYVLLLTKDTREPIALKCKIENVEINN